MINPGSDQEKEYLKYLLKKYGGQKDKSIDDSVEVKHRTDHSHVKKKIN